MYAYDTWEINKYSYLHVSYWNLMALLALSAVCINLWLGAPRVATEDLNIRGLMTGGAAEAGEWATLSRIERGPGEEEGAGFG